MTRVGLGSNILIYASGLDRAASDRAKIERTWQVIERLGRDHNVMVPVQAIGELYAVLVKARWPRTEASKIAARFLEGYDIIPSSEKAIGFALTLATDHHFRLWDALISAACHDADCSILLSEDMQHGFVIGEMTIVNPFTDPPHSKLAALLAD